MSSSEQITTATGVRAEVAFLVLGAVVTTAVRVRQNVEWPATLCEATAWATAILAVLLGRLHR